MSNFKTIFVGTFSEKECREGKDKKAMDVERGKHPDCKYTYSNLHKTGKGYILEVYICNYYC